MYASTSIVRAIVDELRRRGLAQADLVRAAGIDPVELESPTGFVSLDRYNAILRAVSRMVTHDRTFALRVAELTPETAHLVGHLLTACGSLRDAFALFTRYSPLLLEGARFTLHEHGEHASLAFEHPGVAPHLAAAEAEGWLALAMRLGQRFVGNVPPTEVRFAHPRPASLDEHERIFRCPLVFGAVRNELVFPRKILDRKYAHRDEPLRELIRERADQLMTERRSDDRLRGRVKDVLRCQLEAGAVSAEEVAHRLGISARALQRKLGERDTSLSALLDEVRLERAAAALADPAVSIKEIADRLGFSEVSAFHRAFKRWTGMTPQKYRAGLR